MKTTQRVLPNAAPTPVCQGLELGQDEAACQIVLGDAELICHGQVWKALGAITQIPRNLPGPRLGAAVQSSCCSRIESCLCGLERSWDGSSAQSTGRHRQPQYRNAFPNGRLGPQKRSTISGGLSSGASATSPRKGAPKSSPGPPQCFALALHLAAG